MGKNENTIVAMILVLVAATTCRPKIVNPVSKIQKPVTEIAWYTKEPTFVAETIHQILGFVEQHYVEPKKATFNLMIKAGLLALKKPPYPRIDLVLDRAGDIRSVVVDGSSFSLPQTPSNPNIAQFIDAFLNTVSDLSQKPVQSVMSEFANGLLDSLDPHSSYLDRAEYHELRNGTSGQFGGIGIVLDDIQDLPVIREIVPNSPAHVSGLEPGDILLKIGTSRTAFLKVSQSIALLKDVKSDASLPVWIYRPSSSRLLKMFLTREEIPTKSVEQRAVIGRKDILHLKILGFSSRATEEFSKLYSDAIETRQYKYLILDLRNNPGGLLDQAIQISDLFLNRGRIVSTKSRYEEQVETATAGRKVTLPVVVLVNSGSASASEIVAGALRDHNKAVIVGERTFGKGSVQSLFELTAGTALKLTMAHYFTPSGFSIQGHGVEPHVDVKLMTQKGDGLWISGSSEPEREEHFISKLHNPSKILQQSYVSKDLWASLHPRSQVLDALQTLDFNYPFFENRDAITDQAFDPIARVAIQVQDQIMARGYGDSPMKAPLDSILESVQQTEAASILENVSQPKEQKKLAGIFGKFFEAINIKDSTNNTIEMNPQKLGFFQILTGLERITNGLNAGALSCCFGSKYGFRQKRFESGFVSLRMHNERDGPTALIPIDIQDRDADLYSFAVPNSFRTYLSGLENYNQENKISFLLKEKLGDAGVNLGLLPFKQPLFSEMALTTKISSTSTRISASLRHESVKILVSSSEPFLGQFDYNLIIVPLIDQRYKVAGKTIKMRALSKRELVADWEVDFYETGSNDGENFNGVIGGLISTSDGNIVAKIPIATLNQSGLMPVDSK